MTKEELQELLESDKKLSRKKLKEIVKLQSDLLEMKEKEKVEEKDELDAYIQKLEETAKAREADVIKKDNQIKELITEPSEAADNIIEALKKQLKED